MEIEIHPLEPFLPAKSKLLMLGSFPATEKNVGLWILLSKPKQRHVAYIWNLIL